MLLNIWDNQNLIEVLGKNEVAVMPTDTIYGLVGDALNKDTVLRIYNIKKRAPEKPCIILVGSVNELNKFNISLSNEQKNILEKGFENPTSIILDCIDEKFEYLHRGTNTLAFRLPVQAGLRDLLLKTGPLIAPSANPEGLPPAQNILQAKKYFSHGVNMYVDGGTLTGKPSKIIKLHKDGIIDILRN